MKIEEDKRLKEIFSIQSYSGYEFAMFYYIVKQLDKIQGVNYTVDASGNILVTKGNTELVPCICAHIDTVHEIVQPKLYKVVFNDGKITPGTEFTGVGGDDKCGIYALLHILEQEDNIKAAFFTSEEFSCVGSGEVNLDFFSNVAVLIGIDRRGNTNFAHGYNGVISEDFMGAVEPIMNKYGYKTAYIALTDVFKLQGRLTEELNLNIAAVNCACGYYNPHTKDEYVVYEDLLNSIKFVRELISRLRGTVWTYSPEEEEECSGDYFAQEYQQSEMNAVIANMKYEFSRQNCIVSSQGGVDEKFSTFKVYNAEMHFIGEVRIDSDGVEEYTDNAGNTYNVITKFIKNIL